MPSFCNIKADCAALGKIRLEPAHELFVPPHAYDINNPLSVRAHAAVEFLNRQHSALERSAIRKQIKRLRRNRGCLGEDARCRSSCGAARSQRINTAKIYDKTAEEEVRERVETAANRLFSAKKRRRIMSIMRHKEEKDPEISLLNKNARQGALKKHE